LSYPQYSLRAFRSIALLSAQLLKNYSCKKTSRLETQAARLL
jgi:hypothetical protein